MITTVSADILRHRIASARETARHAMLVARFALDHPEDRFEGIHGDPSHRWPLMTSLVEAEETDSEQDSQRAEPHEEWRYCTSGALVRILLHEQKKRRADE